MVSDFPGANSEIASEKHVHQRAGLVRHVHAERFADHRVPLRPVLFVQHLFDRLRRRLSTFFFAAQKTDVSKQ